MTGPSSSRYHCNTRASPNSTAGSIGRLVRDTFWLLFRESVVMPHPTQPGVSPHIKPEKTVKTVIYPCYGDCRGPRLGMTCFFSSFENDLLFFFSGAVNCCIERTKTTTQTPFFFFSNDALSENENPRSRPKKKSLFYFFFSGILMIAFSLRMAKLPIIKIIRISQSSENTFWT